MKVVYIEIEADADELKASRTVGDTLISVLGKIANALDSDDEYEDDDDWEAEE